MAAALSPVVTEMLVALFALNGVQFTTDLGISLVAAFSTFRWSNDAVCLQLDSRFALCGNMIGCATPTDGLLFPLQYDWCCARGLSTIQTGVSITCCIME